MAFNTPKNSSDKGNAFDDRQLEKVVPIDAGRVKHVEEVFGRELALAKEKLKALHIKK